LREEAGLRSVTAILVALLASFPAAAKPGGDGRVGQAFLDRLPASIRQSGTLRVGSQETFPPVEFRAPGDARVQGLGADLLEAAAARMGCRVVYVHAEYANLISGVQADRFDLASGGLSDTEEREQVLDFVNYLRSGVGILQTAGSQEVDRIEDLSGHSAAVLLGSRVIVGAVEAANARLQASGRAPVRLVQLPTAPDARMQLDLGRVDAYLGDLPALVHLNGQFPGKYRIAGGSYAITHYITSWGVAKTSPGLRDSLQAAAQSLVQDGTYARILAKWGCQAYRLPRITVNCPARVPAASQP
jgi:polar amino acid transport system substrate-binding protein